MDYSCKSCDRKGVRVIVRQVVPGMVQRMEAPCSDCNGRGDCIPDKERCVKCRGKKIIDDTIDLEVHIDKGMQSGQKISFYGKAHQGPGETPGDITIVLQESKHFKSDFTRHGDDLVFQHRLTLAEALTGYRFPITHLDDRVLVIESMCDDVVKPGGIRIIENEGFPKFKNPILKGNLYIKFKIIFPEANDLQDERVRAKLMELLPSKPNSNIFIPEDAEECVARPFCEGIDEIGRRDASHRDATASDDEEVGEGRAGCVHQ